MYFRRLISALPVIGKSFMIASLFLVAGSITLAAWNARAAFKEAELRANAADAELAELKARQEELENDINRLETREGLEGELRARFNVAREGEQVIVLVEEESRRKGEEGEAISLSWWERMWGWFR